MSPWEARTEKVVDDSVSALCKKHTQEEKEIRVWALRVGEHLRIAMAVLGITGRWASCFFKEGLRALTEEAKYK